MISPEVEEEIRHRIEEKTRELFYAPNHRGTRDKIRAVIKREIQKAVALGEAPEDFFCFAVFADPIKPTVAMINIWRNFASFPMTKSEFHDWFGRAPENDDLHRVNCKEAGETEHYYCGWCPRHSIARFSCGCLSSMDPPL